MVDRIRVQNVSPIRWPSAQPGINLCYALPLRHNWPLEKLVCKETRVLQ